MNKIAAYGLGLITLLVAGVLGLKGEDIKSELCKAEALPAVVAPQEPIKEEVK